MKKIAKFLTVAALAALALVACNKPNTPSKQDKDNKDNKENKDDTPQEEIKLAVDGKFAEWDAVDPIEGEDAILMVKTQTTDAKLFFYVEIDVNYLYADDCSYANYLSLYFDTDGSGTDSVTYWGGEEGATYDTLIQIWLMQKGKASMANWWEGGFAGRAKIEDGIYRAEFSLGRSTDQLKTKIIHFGVSLTDQYVEYPEDGAEEGAWVPGENVGLAPAEGDDLARIK